MSKIKESIRGFEKISNFQFLILTFIFGASQKARAVLRAEIQMETRRSSIPSFLAINMPPPTVMMQMGHCAPTGGARNPPTPKATARQSKNENINIIGIAYY